MISAWTQVEGDLNRLRELAGFTGALMEPSSHGVIGPAASAPAGAQVRKLNYISTVVSMYGFLEESVDRILLNVVEVYEGLYRTYGDLPNPVRAHHRSTVFRLLADESSSPRVRGIFDPAAALKSVVAASSPGAVARLDGSVFTYSTANYRLGVIEQLFDRVGIDVRNCAASEFVTRSMSEVALPFASFEEFLKDLAQRRNEVAHSFNPQSDLLSSDFLHAYIEVLGAYLRGLASAVTAHLCSVAVAQDRLDCVGTVAKVWARRSSFGADVERGEIGLGSVLVVHKGAKAFVCVVRSMRIHDVTVSRAVIKRGIVNLGVGADVAPEGWIEGSSLYVVPREIVGLL